MGAVELTTARFMIKQAMDRFWTFFICFNYLSFCGFQTAFSQEVSLSNVKGISSQSASAVADYVIPECGCLKSSPGQSNSFRTDDGRICCMCPAGKYLKKLCSPKIPESTNCRRCPRKNGKRTYMHFEPHMEKKCYADTTTCMSPMILVKGNRFNKSRCECPPKYEKFGSLCLPVVSKPPTMNSEERLSNTTRVVIQTSRLPTRTDIEEKNAKIGTERESFTTSQTEKSVTIPKARLQAKADVGKKNAELATEGKGSTSQAEQTVTSKESATVMNTSLTMTTTATLLEPELATQTTSSDHAEGTDVGRSVITWSVIIAFLLLLSASSWICIDEFRHKGRSLLSDAVELCLGVSEKDLDSIHENLNAAAVNESLLGHGDSRLAVATGYSDDRNDDVKTVVELEEIGIDPDGNEPEQITIVQTVFSEIANVIHSMDLKYVGRKLLRPYEFEAIYYRQDMASTSEKAHMIFRRTSELNPEIGIQEILVAVDGYGYLEDIINDTGQFRTEGDIITDTGQLRTNGDIVTDTGELHTVVDNVVSIDIVTDTGQLPKDGKIVTDTGQLRTDWV